jgi:hypothetical protein
MFVARWVIEVKKGRINDVVNVIKSRPDYGLPQAPAERLYTPTLFGPRNVVIIESDYEDQAEYEAVMKKMWAAPRWREWWDTYQELLERGGHGEQWHMEYLT